MHRNIERGVCQRELSRQLKKSQKHEEQFKEHPRKPYKHDIIRTIMKAKGNLKRIPKELKMYTRKP